MDAMFHVPAITFSAIDRFVIEFAVAAATGISVYQFLRFKLRSSKYGRKKKSDKATARVRIRKQAK